jgi:ribosomal protein L11 methyltransferase
LLFLDLAAFLCSMASVSVRLTLQTPDDLNAEIVSSFLSAHPFTGFEQTREGLLAWYEGDPDATWLADALDEVKEWLKEAPQIEQVADQNWNALWEAQIEPLRIADRLWVRGSFHPPAPEPGMLEITVDPKMSFGTGHHPTTALMCRFLLENPPVGQKVCDMGTGTGLLAILAEKLGAVDVLAIDNDQWSVENTRENLELNGCSHIRIEAGDADFLAASGETGFQCFLANIHKQILTRDVPVYARSMDNGALLAVSGFFDSDLADLAQAFEQQGLQLHSHAIEQGWCCAVFRKAVAA